MIFIQCIDDSYAAEDDTPVEKNEANKSQKPSAGDDNVPGWEKKFDPKVEILYNMYIRLN